MATIKVRIGVLVDDEGNWAGQGHCRLDDPDWSWLDEWMNPDQAPKGLRRYFITAEIPIPDVAIQEVSASTVELISTEETSK